MDEARTSNGTLTRIGLFRKLKMLFKKFSRGYKVALVQFYLIKSDGSVAKGESETVRNSDSLVAYLFEKSFSYSICGIQTSDTYPHCHIFLVENEDKTTTNIDNHFIDVISKLEFQKEPAK